MPRIQCPAETRNDLTPTLRPIRSFGCLMPFVVLMNTKPWRKRRCRNTGSAVTGTPWSRATMYEEPDVSAMSKSPLRMKRQCRVVESMSVRMVRSMPSGSTSPSLRARTIS